MRKRFIYILVFIIFTVFIAIKYEYVIKNKFQAYSIKQYYYEKNNIDVFFLGTSRVYFTLSPMEVWNKYGIVSYNRGTAQQSYKLSFLFLEEILLRHKPKVIMYDINYLENLLQNSYQTMIHLQNLKNNFFKLYAYKYIYQNTDDLYKKINTINLFHSRWEELHKYDFVYDTFWKGRFLGSYDGSRWYKMHEIRKVKKYENTNIIPVQLETDTIKYANMMVDLANKHNCKILFVKIPHSTNDNQLQKDKAFELYAKEQGWDFINYNLMYDEINLDFNRDFRDGSHINLYGGRKVIDHLVPYIIENYNIPIRKDDPKYASWNEDYVKYARAVNREEIRELKSFQEWQNFAYYDNYTMLISTNGDNVLNRLPQNMQDKFKTLGLTKFETDKKNQKYVAIIDDNQVFFEEISDKKAEYKGRMKNKVNLLVSSESNNAVINVSGKPRAKNKYGINFVIYDKVNREIVDSIWIDPAKPNNVRR